MADRNRCQKLVTDPTTRVSYCQTTMRRCKNDAAPDSDYCHVHSSEGEEKEETANEELERRVEAGEDINEVAAEIAARD